MAVYADLPASAELLAGPGRWRARYSALAGEQTAFWLVDFAEVAAFRIAALFKPETITVPGGSITRNVPLQAKWDPNLYAVDVQFESLSASEDDPEDVDAQDWEKALAAVTFAQPAYPVEGARPYVEIQTDGETIDYTLPNFTYSFLGTTPLELIAQDIIRPVTVTRKTIVWHQLDDPDAAEAIVGALQNHVNNATLAIGGLSCPADTVHFQKYSIGETRLSNNTRNARLSIALAIRLYPTWQEAMRKNGSFGTVDPLPFPQRSNLSVLVNGY